MLLTDECLLKKVKAGVQAGKITKAFEAKLIKFCCSSSLRPEIPRIHDSKQRLKALRNIRNFHLFRLLAAA